MVPGNNAPISLLSQVRALFLLTEHTVTVEEQGLYPECVFWKAGDVCSPLGAGLEDACHVRFQKCLLEMWHPSLVAPQRGEPLYWGRILSPTPALSAGPCGVACACTYEMSGVLALFSKMPKATLEHLHSRATPAMCRLGRFPPTPEQDWEPQRYPPLRSCWSPAGCLTLG